MFYSSINNKKIKNLNHLKQKKYRDKESLFLIEGEHLIQEAYKAGFLVEVLSVDEINLDTKITYITPQVRKYLTSLDNPSVIGVCKKKSDTLKGEKIVCLENIQDPGNLGTIIRSCVAFNIDTLILNNCVDMYNSKVLRATQGLIFHLNIINNYDINNLKKMGYKIYGTKVTNGKNVKTIAKVSKFVIIMGNEGNGISKEMSDICDEFIYIDMNPKCESLNVGVATSIILYELGGNDGIYR